MADPRGDKKATWLSQVAHYDPRSTSCLDASPRFLHDYPFRMCALILKSAEYTPRPSTCQATIQVEMSGLEPLTSSVQRRRSPN